MFGIHITPMDLYASFVAMPPLHKLFVLIAIATVFCSIATDCVLCKHWPLTVSARWKNPFEHFENAQPLKVVFYGTAWCTHCQSLKGPWAELEKAYAGSQVSLSFVDCDKEPELAKEQNITGYPTVILFKGTEKVVYQGERTTAAMKAWIDSQ